MAVTADIKEAKYTQGFRFQQKEGSRVQPRQVVERSCTALSTLLQELFVQLEKELSAQLTLNDPSPSRQRLLEQLGEVVCARPVVERVMMASVVCAFAELEDRAGVHPDNRPMITQTLAAIKSQFHGTEDLMTLLEVGKKIAAANNATRPLLLHLNAQWVLVFGLPEFRLQNSPLGPATLSASFIAGLSCTRAGLATRRLLFQMFDRYVLGRLSMLLNSITLRLEEEGIQIQKAVSFDELDAGPVHAVLEVSRPVDAERMRIHRQRIQEAISQKTEFVAVSPDVRKTLGSFLQDESVESYVNLLGELAAIRCELEPVFLRADIHHQETRALAAIRQGIADQINQQLAGRSLPVSIGEFFSQQWPDVLFEVATTHGTNSKEWENTLLVQEQLLTSVSPAVGEDPRKELSRVVPSLVKALREHLERAGYFFADTSHFFSQLKQLHLANVQRKLETTDFISWQSLSLDACVPTESVMTSDADRVFYEQVRAVVG